MSNRIIIYGRLGRDSEVKEINGKRVLILNVASSHKTKDEPVTVWRRVTFWNDNHRKMEQYLTKGAAVVIVGEEQPPRIYDNKVQLEVVGKDLSFNPFAGKKKEEEVKISQSVPASADDPRMQAC